MPNNDLEFTAQYSLNSYTISYELNGGIISEGKNRTSYTIEDLPITLINPVKQGYEFKGWIGDGLDGLTTQVIIPENSVGNRTYTAIFPVDATYTVKHYQQNLDGSYPSEPTEIEVINGISEQETNAQTKTYTGFTAKSFEQQEISSENNTVIEIQYERNEYIIKWIDEDGSILDQINCLYGSAIPAYTKPLPTKQNSAQYTYTYDRFKPNVDISDIVTENITFTASYTETTNKYRITFQNYDGSVLQEGEYEYGEIPSYSGETPIKPNSEQFTYSFDGWTPDIVMVTEEQSYVAVFSEIPIIVDKEFVFTTTNHYATNTDGKAIFWLANDGRSTLDIVYDIYNDKEHTIKANADTEVVWSVEMVGGFENYNFDAQMEAFFPSTSRNTTWDAENENNKVSVQSIKSGIYKVSVTIEGNSDYCYVVVPGDVNRDAHIQANDASIVLRYSSNINPPINDGFTKALSDMNNDGYIQANDASMILRK